MDELETTYIPHLRAQFERGRPILFTGAGFSLSARSVDGKFLPTARGLKEDLWALCFPDDKFDSETTLPDLFEFAVHRNKAKLSELLTRTFTVSETDLPSWYGNVLSLPWQRVYTLNIDDLEQAVARSYNLPRMIRSNSVKKAEEGRFYSSKVLEVMHLNGSLDEVPDGVTFSVTQYAQRLASQDSVYRRLAGELIISPFVFIGSALEEPTLWQSIEARRWKGSREQRELRPRSYLVTPQLSPAKRALLGDFNVVWLPMTAEEFSEKVLSQIGDAARKGLGCLLAQAQVETIRKTIPDVTELAVNPNEGSQYLLGFEPIWADIQTGRAIERANDCDIWSLVEKMWAKGGPKGLIVISGTSGSGKSTALMRVSLRLSAGGAPVSWVNPEEGVSPRDLRAHAREKREPYVVAIDDADLYGPQLTALLRELVIADVPALVLVAIRSGRVDRAITSVLLDCVPHSEVTVPLLADDDIDKLIDVLHRENRPGRLKGLPLERQRALFREQSGRELLVAMIQATSGEKFRDRTVNEMTELAPEAARIYGLVAVATAFRFGLSSQDVLIALGDETNSALNALEMLVKRSLLRRAGDGLVYARHRIIAEVIRDALQENGQLGGIVQGLALVAASQSRQESRQSSRARRILRAIINHDFLRRNLGIDTTRNLYASLEEILPWDYHFWLQRGSFEVEMGDLSLAENFLNQARGLRPGDPLVETEWAYLLFSKANANSASEGAARAVEEATEILEFQMRRLDRTDPYAFHVMGSQGLAWSRRAIPSKTAREKYLRQLISHIEEGLKRFVSDKNLCQLLEDIKREHLGLAVQPQKSLFSS